MVDGATSDRKLSVVSHLPCLGCPLRFSRFSRLDPGHGDILDSVTGTERASSFGGSSWRNEDMADATITVDAALKERLSDLASKTGQHVDEFVEALLRRVAEADVRFERGVPVFPRRPGAPTLTVADVDRLADGQ